MLLFPIDQRFSMPFTLAHPAAVIPVSKLLGKRSSLSALAIGSMIPDIVYFLPLGVNGRVSHSLPALIWFCLPVGLVVYLLFHAFIKRPAAALLPPAVISRFPAHVLDGAWFGPMPLGIVILSLGLGALTHIGWDAFTHGHTDVVARFDFLRAEVGYIGDYPVRLYKVLQHVSSAVGLLSLALWIQAWFNRSQPIHKMGYMHSLSLRSRAFIIGAITASALVFGIARGALTSHRSTEHVIVQMTVGGLVGAGIAAAAFCIGWHVYVARRSRYA